MTTDQFNQSVNAEIRRLIQQGEDSKAKPYAIQVCNAGAMPESFEEWLRSNGDSIEDIGGNWEPSKVAANQDQYSKLPF